MVCCFYLVIYGVVLLLFLVYLGVVVLLVAVDCLCLLGLVLFGLGLCVICLVFAFSCYSCDLLCCLQFVYLELWVLMLCVCLYCDCFVYCLVCLMLVRRGLLRFILGWLICGV